MVAIEQENVSIVKLLLELPKVDVNKGPTVSILLMDSQKLISGLSDSPVSGMLSRQFKDSLSSSATRRCGCESRK